MNSRYRQTHFLIGAASLSQLPPDCGCEVALAGRSNAGKSSALNAITDQRALARTSKTPGRTQQINYFAVDDDRYLVDLPGYGYAKVPPAVSQRWQQAISDYLHSRQSLKGLILVMDCRHPLKAFDCQLLDWCFEAQLPAHVLLSKADKLSRGAASAVLQQVGREFMRAYPDGRRPTVQLFSALKKTGLTEVYAQLDAWLFAEPSSG